MSPSSPQGAPPARAPRLDAAAVARGMRLSVFEGATFAAMVGLGEAFFLADAIRLGATRLEQGLVVALPLFFGAFGPLLGLAALTRLRARRWLVAGACFLQAAVLVSLSLAAYLGSSSPALLIGGAVLYGVCGQAGGTAWSSWFGDLVPPDVRGRYFGRRNRWVYVTTFAAILTGGALLDALELGPPTAGNAGSGAGFALVYALAAGFRVASAALHLATPEPPFGGLAPRARATRYLRTREGRGVARLLLASAAFYFAVYLASPYFTPFMLQELDFTYLEYTIAAGSVVVAKVAFVPVWGSAVDAQGPRALLLLAAVLIGIVPLPYLWAQGLGWVVVGQMLSGLSWAAYELSLFSLVLDRTYRRIRPHVFAVQSALTGTAQLAGTLAGAALVSGVGWIDLRMLFAISLGARLAVALALPVFVRVQAGEADVGRRVLLMRAIGFRPSGGLVMRALPERDDER